MNLAQKFRTQVLESMVIYGVVFGTGGWDRSPDRYLSQFCIFSNFTREVVELNLWFRTRESSVVFSCTLLNKETLVQTLG